ncbi:hypothetical protein COB57_05485 [Candidatus Peregrinibacteria bacterium]|nr:MAG: hypothetical protein COB57_05485 [Candidatus Peregrinibacteria bacterium]
MIQDLIQEIKDTQKNFSIPNIEKAFLFAQKAHEGQIRESGEAYISHPVGVAQVLLSIDCDEAMVISALLHDTVEDTDTTLEDIEQNFGKEIAIIIEGLTKIKRAEIIGLDRQVDNIRKMFLAMAKDIRVIYVKLADRIHNLQTIDVCTPKKQERIAKESLHIYAPIATRLGIYWFKEAVEDRCFQILHPKEYKALAKKIHTYFSKQEQTLALAKQQIAEALGDIPFQPIQSRAKQMYSLFKKLEKRKEENLDNIYDFFAVRIITDTVENCYRALGAIHKQWTPMTNRIKDYIAVPKSNGYQSLHTTILGIGKSGNRKIMEIQIRTETMHKASEQGASAHWAYKENVNNDNQRWLQHLVSLASNIEQSEEFMEGLTKDPLKYRIFVLTPHGEIKDLPHHSTPIDFAYCVHTDIGNHIMTALINGKAVALDTPLQDGDVVEIKTNKNKEPNLTWINIVKTQHAKSCIKAWLRNKSKSSLIKTGRESINKLLQSIGKSVLDPHYSLLKEYKNKNLSLKERETIILRVGEGSQKASDIIKNIFFQEAKQQKPKEIQSTTEEHHAYVVGGADLSIKISPCCAPKPFEKITGFVTRGSHVSVHSIHCPFIVNNNEKDRCVDCLWEGEIPNFEVTYIFTVNNKLGMLSKITHFFAKHDINTISMNFITNKNDKNIIITTIIELSDFDKLDFIYDSLSLLPDMQTIEYTITI